MQKIPAAALGGRRSRTVCCRRLDILWVLLHSFQSFDKRARRRARRMDLEGSAVFAGADWAPAGEGGGGLSSGEAAGASATGISAAAVGGESMTAPVPLPNIVFTSASCRGLLKAR